MTTAPSLGRGTAPGHASASPCRALPATTRKLGIDVPVGKVRFYDAEKGFGFLTKDDLEAMISEYRNITDAILAGDPAWAELQTRRHLQKSRERVLPYLSSSSISASR